MGWSKKLLSLNENLQKQILTIYLPSSGDKYDKFNVFSDREKGQITLNPSTVLY